MKHYISIFGLAVAMLLLSMSAAAQAPQRGGHRFSPEEFAQKCDCFITTEAKLTPQEAQKFLPLYHAMKDAQRKLMQEKGHLMREAMKDEANDKQNLKTLERLIAIDRQVVDIEQDYQKKMLKVLSPSKLLRIKGAEKKFERQMLHKMAPHHRKGEKSRK
ncbi:MAG: hypothetical protein IJT90_09465 [Bacteroidaceae bacterium]|nr:hypothetical protein [Bacteroidaceae bacterium]